jgi:hypothetical protein
MVVFSCFNLLATNNNLQLYVNRDISHEIEVGVNTGFSHYDYLME